MGSDADAMNSRLMPRSFIEERPGGRDLPSAPLPSARFDVLPLGSLGTPTQPAAPSHSPSPDDPPEAVTGENYIKSYKASRLRETGLVQGAAEEHETDPLQRYFNESKHRREQAIKEVTQKEEEQKEWNRQQDQAQELEAAKKAQEDVEDARRLENDIAYWESQSGAGTQDENVVSATLEDLKRQLDNIPPENRR